MPWKLIRPARRCGLAPPQRVAAAHKAPSAALHTAPMIVLAALCAPLKDTSAAHSRSAPLLDEAPAFAYRDRWASKRIRGPKTSLFAGTGERLSPYLRPKSQRPARGEAGDRTRPSDGPATITASRLGPRLPIRESSDHDSRSTRSVANRTFLGLGGQGAVVSPHDAAGMEGRMDAIRLKQILGDPLIEQELMCLQIEQNGFGCHACPNEPASPPLHGTAPSG